MDEPTVTADHGGRRFEIGRPEVVLADRLVGFRHWPGTTAWAVQAAAMLSSLGASLDRPWLLKRLEREGAVDALEAIEVWIASGRPLTEGGAEVLQDRLRGQKRGGPAGRER